MFTSRGLHPKRCPPAKSQKSQFVQTASLCWIYILHPKIQETRAIISVEAAPYDSWQADRMQSEIESNLGAETRMLGGIVSYLMERRAAFYLVFSFLWQVLHTSRRQIPFHATLTPFIGRAREKNTVPLSVPGNAPGSIFHTHLWSKMCTPELIESSQIPSCQQIFFVQNIQMNNQATGKKRHVHERSVTKWRHNIWKQASLNTKCTWFLSLIKICVQPPGANSYICSLR